MEKKVLFSKIKSKYIIEIIKSYIKNNTKFLYKFVYSSKIAHKIFKLELFDLQEKYLNKRINWEKYICNYDDINNPGYIKHYLTKEFKNDLLNYKIDNKVLENVIINYFNNKKIEELIEISIFSPLFDIL